MHAATIVTSALGGVDRAAVTQFIANGFDPSLMATGRSREFLGSVGKELFKNNMSVVGKLKSGEKVFGLDPKTVSVKEIDQAWVRFEQGLVQNRLDSLQKADPLSFRQVVHLGTESIKALKNDAIPRLSDPQQVYAVDLIQSKMKSQTWDFSNLSDRVLMGYAATQAAREAIGEE